MTTITVKTSRTYDVVIGKGLLDSIGARLSGLIPPKSAVFLVSDDHVYPLYGETVCGALEAAGFTVFTHIAPAGERSKDAHRLTKLWLQLADAGFTRSDCVVALGGGVIGDLAGFAAATYLRGIPYYQVPTSLLAMVDSSVGGKTAINLAAGKNLCGAFWQPIEVLCDPAVLTTLPEDYLADGMAEILKYGYIGNPALLEVLAGDIKNSMEDVIARCVAHKRDIVEADERESGIRRLLNLGHTAGHAIEKLSEHRIPHGHAVAIGMLLAAKAAVALSLCDESLPAHMEGLLTRYGLDTVCPYRAEELARYALLDKKRTGNHITLILPTAIGKSVTYQIAASALTDFFLKGGAPA